MEQKLSANKNLIIKSSSVNVNHNNNNNEFNSNINEDDISEINVMKQVRN